MLGSCLLLEPYLGLLFMLIGCDGMHVAKGASEYFIASLDKAMGATATFLICQNTMKKGQKMVHDAYHIWLGW